MKILVTGICGFAGSVITRTLLEHRPGLRVVGLDNLSRKGSETNLEPLRALGCDLRIGDVRDRSVLEKLPAADWIIDCAANPSVLAGVDGSSSRDLVDQNLYGTVNLLELCKSWDAGFTLLSTSRVYSIAALAGLPMVETPMRFELPPAACGSGWSRNGITEEFPATPPVSLYGSTKLCSELLALEYGEAFGFPVWINRCGVLAGAGQFGKADQGIFSYWIHSWRAGRSLKYIGFGGSGLQVRDCLHPRDIGPLLLKQIDFRGAEKPPVINLAGGYGNSMSLRELSGWCAEKIGPSLPANDPNGISSGASNRPFDIPWAILDSRLALDSWGWEPSTPLSEVLEEILDHAIACPGWLDLAGA
ncbi:MAG: NAD-dependent epimerase/dehydratase family protein [bacterium]